MSRIEEDELFTIDVEWYGIDKKGNIAVFCSAGEANVPEFVCADKERYEFLVEWFDNLPSISEVQFCFNCSPRNTMPLVVAKEFSEKGLFYFDSDDHSKASKNIGVFQRYYTISSKPVTPIRITDLPLHIQEILKDNYLPIDDFSKVNTIEVDHAYD